MTPILSDRSQLNKAGAEFSDAAFMRIQRILKNLCRFNLESYKGKCMMRRIAIRVRATHCQSAEEYADMLLVDESERDRLVKVLTIHVSQFFRNPPTFEKLRREALPYLFNRCGTSGMGELRLWSVGCAAGEEPYSLAIIVREYFAEEMQHLPVSILATDVDAGILQNASQGLYGDDRLAGVEPALRDRYFEPAAGKFQLNEEIRRMVTFRQGDLFDKDRYPASDLILCRNVLIYFERNQQEKILNGFARVLPTGGILVLGKSETLVGDTRRHFQPICPVERMYRKL